MNPFEIKIPEERMRVILIIALSLPAGTLLFLLLVATAINPPAAPFNFGIDVYEMVFLAQVVIVLPASFIVPQIVFRNTAEQAFKGINLQAEIEQESFKDAPPKQTERFLGIFTTQMIIGLALLEGIAIFGIIVFLLEQSMICLIGSGVLILLMFARFPTMARIQNSLANLARDQEIKGDRNL